MKRSSNIALVTTIKERCRVCFTCVRECPAKAIRIADGQAEIIPERCIGCGNCVRVCSQGAKQVLDCTSRVDHLLATGAVVAACVAPSFPAEFADCDSRQFVGMLRAMGFRYVHEVGFGADLVADRYRKLLDKTKDERYIATSCPAVVAFVEHYHPDLVPCLAPIVSPMVATARVVRRIHGAQVKVVFIGPCVAKKGEMLSEVLPREIDHVVVYDELRRMLQEHNITPEAVKPSDFDPPHAGPGGLFPIGGGLLQAADIEEDLMTGEVVTANGRQDFVEAIKEFETGDMDVQLLEVLACQGCISGPGFRTDAALFRRRRRVSRYVRMRAAEVDAEQWRRDIARFDDLDLSRGFCTDDQRLKSPSEEEVRLVLVRMGKSGPEDELNCGACGYATCREHAIAICKGLAESEMCLPYSIDELRRTVQELAVSNKQLEATQEALMQSEKLASMGQLAAGIAHELNNPLGVVLMYTHILQREYAKEGKPDDDLKLITEQADRCKKIVAGLLHFARQNKVLLKPTDLREVVKNGLAAITIPENITVNVEHQMEDPFVDLDRDQIVQVLTNLLTNACAAMPAGGTLNIQTRSNGAHVELRVSDTGTGIAKDHLGKIFEPFFTTKGIGKGTGLGLAITYGIVKMHRGDIRVESNADPAAGPTGATFTVSLPRHGDS